MWLLLTLMVLVSASVTLVHAANANIPLGSTLRVGQQPWTSSPTGLFSVGLSSKSNNTGTTTFNLAVWFSATPAIWVWSAVTPDQSFQLNLSRNAMLRLEKEGFVLQDGAHQQVVWRTCNHSCATVQSASLLDTGNLVLQSANNSLVWTSFDYPTDTLLPGQAIKGLTQTLSSGKYRLRLEKTQALLESTIFKPPNSVHSRKQHRYYWVLQTRTSNAVPDQEIEPLLNFSSSGVLSFFNVSGKAETDDYPQKTCKHSLRSESTVRYGIDYSSPDVKMRRVKLEDSGNLVMYSFKGGSEWVVAWQAMLNECEIHATCGAFALCSFQPTRTCTCPPGFQPHSDSDSSLGCERKAPLGTCDANSAGTPTKYVEIVRAHYEYGNEDVSDDATLPIRSLQGCKDSCENDCTCLGVEYKIDGTAVCYRKMGTEGDKLLYNGRQSIGGEAHAIVFLKVAKSDTSAESLLSDPFVTNVSAVNPAAPIVHKEVVESQFGKRAHVAVYSLAAAFLVGLVAVIGILRLLWYQDIKHRMLFKQSLKIQGVPATFSYKELQAATNNFSESLGSGGFGSVYKGVLPDGLVIAVKELQGTIAEQQFKAEVSTIAKVHHVNLVRMLGFCAEGQHRLLVLEYMPNGSLEKLLFEGIGSDDHEQGVFSSWVTRFSVALGIARGITYLHEECHECILHCDIKPHNILLDHNFSPKVADFGLAKLVDKERALTVSTIRGTRGYIAPEWLSDSQITSKVDVYSFGMVLMGIISGRSKFTISASVVATDSEDDKKGNFSIWAFEKLRELDLISIADPRLEKESIDWKQFERVVKVAFWCVQVDSNARPNMSKVVQMLEDNMEVSQPPLPMDDEPYLVMGGLVSSSSASATSASASGGTSQSLTGR